MVGQAACQPACRAVARSAYCRFDVMHAAPGQAQPTSAETSTLHLLGRRRRPSLAIRSACAEAFRKYAYGLHCPPFDNHADQLRTNSTYANRQMGRASKRQRWQEPGWSPRPPWKVREIPSPNRYDVGRSRQISLTSDSWWLKGCARLWTSHVAGPDRYTMLTDEAGSTALTDARTTATHA